MVAVVGLILVAAALEEVLMVVIRIRGSGGVNSDGGENPIYDGGGIGGADAVVGRAVRVW